MESGAGRWIHMVGKFLRQHRPSWRIDLETRDVSRARSTKRKSDYRTDGPASRTGHYGPDRSAIRRVRRRPAGGAFKCTFCYDRQKSGLVPACAKVCPTESIVFGRLDDLRARGAERVQQ